MADAASERGAKQAGLKTGMGMKAKLTAAIEDVRQRVRVAKAKRGRARSKATFIAITGSSGKSTATSLLGHLLANHGTVYSQFLANSMRSLVNTLYKRMQRAGDLDYVVFEAGAHGMGTIKPMADIFRPHVAVVTMVRLEHYSSFRKIENVAEEKSTLLDALMPGGFAVLNADDPHVAAMAGRTDHRVVTFGMSEGVDYRVADVHAAYPQLLTFTLRWKENALRVAAPFPADYFWLPVAAAVVTALELGMPPEKVAAALKTFKPLANRCEVVPIDGGPQFIVDAAKSPWHSLYMALDMVAKSTVARKRIVLGQISDYAGSTRKYHYAYKVAREAADEVIYTGDNAHKADAAQADIDSGRFLELRSAKEVSDHIKRTAVPGELILLKSSSNLHLERVALAWKHDVKCWVPSCKKREDCHTCGLYEVPYEEHDQHVRGLRRARRWQRVRRLFGA